MDYICLTVGFNESQTIYPLCFSAWNITFCIHLSGYMVLVILSIILFDCISLLIINTIGCLTKERALFMYYWY